MAARPSYAQLSWMRGVTYTEGRCIDCGLLTRRRTDPEQPVTHDEIPMEHRQGPIGVLGARSPEFGIDLSHPLTSEDVERNDQQFFQIMQGTRMLRDSNGNPATIWCFVGAADLPAELDERFASDKDPWLAGGIELPDPPREISAVSVLIKDRKCPQWTPYTEGFSPKEHLEELRMLQLEQRRQELQERLNADHKAVSEAVRDINAQALEYAKRADEFTRLAAKLSGRWQWIFAIFACLTFAVALLALFGALWPDQVKVGLDHLLHLQWP